MASKRDAYKNNLVKVESSISDVLLKYDNPSTRAGYKNAIETFLRCVNGLPKKEGKKKVEYDYQTLLNSYVKNKKKDTSADFIKFSNCLKAESTSVLSAKQVMTLARTFLSRFGVVVDYNTVMDLKRGLKGRAATKNHKMTTDVIEKALKEMDAMGRALILTLCSSGMRIEECISLKETDIDFNSSPVWVYVRDTKTKTPRDTFITEEAKQAIKEWLPLRDAYIAGSSGRNKALIKAGLSKEKDAGSGLVFPFSVNTASVMWENALKASNQFTQDEQTGRNQLRVHSLRGFFITTFKNAKMDAIGESLAGHDGYCNGAYDHFTRDMLEGAYNDVKGDLTIGVPPEIRKTYQETNKQVKRLDNAYEGLENKNVEMQRTIERQSAMMTEQSEMMRRLTERLEQMELVIMEERKE